jgi:hypothetical protein
VRDALAVTMGAVGVLWGLLVLNSVQVLDTRLLVALFVVAHFCLAALLTSAAHNSTRYRRRER